MNEYMSTVIIALITGIFSVITLMIQKRQDKVINKIDEQTSFIEKEKELKRKLDNAEKEKQLVIHDIMMITLDTNIYIMKSTATAENASVVEECVKKADELREHYITITETIREIGKDYDLVLDMTSKFTAELQRTREGK